MSCPVPNDAAKSKTSNNGPNFLSSILIPVTIVSLRLELLLRVIIATAADDNVLLSDLCWKAPYNLRNHLVQAMRNVQVLLLLGLLAAITGAEQCIGSCCDKDEQCLEEAESGECAERPGWMLRNCPVSCGLCPEQSKCPSVHTIEGK
uniref:ShKT domain-containing protein n=1 Tax=Steinernema glaseri TaxID=37863 RepID=A0A1I7Y6I7_9BILA